ncbi:MAG: type II secretion system F family protein [Candidatus Eremiobacteraeota bacterium]|nr:type II secretion system F family protein [Candidatus Eremiobacteraeota bacterium]
MRYRYRCRDAQGRAQNGVLEADSVAQAAEQIRARKWTLEDLEPVGARSASVARPVSPPVAAPAGRLSPAQVAQFTVQLSILLEAGVALVPALDTLSQSYPALEAVIRRLESGSSFHVSLSVCGESFDARYLSLLSIGEKTGRLVAVLRRLGEELADEVQRSARLRGALVYPLFLCAACMAMLVFLITVLLPQLLKVVPITQDSPWPTRMVLALTQLPWVPLLILGGVALWQLRRAGGAWLEQLPVVGPHLRQLAWTRVARSLHLMLSSGMLVSQMLPRIYARGSGSAAMDQMLRQAQGRLMEEGSLADALAEQGQVPPLLLQLLRVGEDTGELEVFLKLYVFLAECELEEQRQSFLVLLEPLLLGSLGMVVAFVVMAAFLPVYQLVVAV